MRKKALSETSTSAIEVFGSVLATFFLLRLLSLFGRRTWQILASLVVIISAAASYYMTFMNVVIGYGIVASVMTTDIDLSKEVVGKGFIVWTVLTCLIPDRSPYQQTGQQDDDDISDPLFTRAQLA